MRFLPLTLLYCMLNVFSSDPALEYPSSSPTKILKYINANPTTTNDVVEPRAANIIYQSKDGGQTWQDISDGLPENEQPEGFFAGESDLYLRVKNVMYRSKSNLNTPVWEKENVLDPRSASIAFNRSADMVESEGVLIATGQKGIRRSTDNGEHWEWVISEGGVGIAVERIEGGFAAISYNTTTKSRRIRISVDSGKTWKAIDEGLPASLSISSIKQMGKYLLCGHPDGIFRSSDMGKTWSIVHPGVDNVFKIIGASGNNRKVFKIFVSGNVLYAVAGSAGC
jgi:photosystem II stability/assembly factor-like uncharacterized protein